MEPMTEAREMAILPTVPMANRTMAQVTIRRRPPRVSGRRLSNRLYGFDSCHHVDHRRAIMSGGRRIATGCQSGLYEGTFPMPEEQSQAFRRAKPEEAAFLHALTGRSSLSWGY